MPGLSFAAERTFNPRWWFTSGAVRVPAREYATTDGFDLLYTGISPRKPTAAGKASTANIRSRLRSLAKRDASWSTLRLSLGILLADDLGLTLALHSTGPLGDWRGDAHRVDATACASELGA